MLKKVLEFYFKSYFRFELNLETLDEQVLQSKHQLALPFRFNFKILEPNDIHLFESAGYSEEQLISKRKRLLDREHRRCFAVIDETTGRLAYSCWTNSLHRYYHKEFEREFVHHGEQVLFETDFTEPDYRRLGLHSFCMLQRILFSKKEGFSVAAINIHIRNRAALKTVEKFGFRKSWTIPFVYRKGTLTYTWNKLFN